MRLFRIVPLLIIALAFAIAALANGCGGGGPPAQFIAPVIQSITINPGPPPAPTPTPSVGATTPTPTATAAPMASPTSALMGTQPQFNAQGGFSDGSFADVTNSAKWSSSNVGALRPLMPGQFAAISPGCACISASSGQVISLPVQITVVGPSPSPTPSPCPPCATPVPSPTPTQ